MSKKNVVIVFLLISFIFVKPCFAVHFTSSSPQVNMVIRFLSATKSKTRGSVFIAIDAAEQRRRGGIALFSGTVRKNDILHAVYDPAKLPYLAQAVMKAMSAADKENYSYYQRRLAEFQANIDSSINVGRYLLPQAVNMLDLSGVAGSLISAAHEKIEIPEESEKQRWKNGDIESLNRLIDLADKKGSIILIDRWTPAPVLGCLQGYSRVITLPAIETSSNYFLSLNAAYKYTANRIRAIEAQPKQQKNNIKLKGKVDKK